MNKNIIVLYSYSILSKDNVIQTILLFLGIFAAVVLAIFILFLIARRIKAKKCSNCDDKLVKKGVQFKCNNCRLTYIQTTGLGLKDVTSELDRQSRDERKERLDKHKKTHKRLGFLYTLFILLLIALVLSPVIYFEYDRAMGIMSYNDSPFDIQVSVADDYMDADSFLNVTAHITNNWDKAIPRSGYIFIVYVVGQLEVFISIDLENNEVDVFEEAGPNASVAPGADGDINFIYELDGTKEGKCYLILEVREAEWDQDGDSVIKTIKTVGRTKTNVELV